MLAAIEWMAATQGSALRLKRCFEQLHHTPDNAWRRTWWAVSPKAEYEGIHPSRMQLDASLLSIV